MVVFGRGEDARRLAQLRWGDREITTSQWRDAIRPVAGIPLRERGVGSSLAPGHSRRLRDDARSLRLPIGIGGRRRRPAHAALRSQRRRATGPPGRPGRRARTDVRRAGRSGQSRRPRARTPRSPTRGSRGGGMPPFDRGARCIPRRAEGGRGIRSRRSRGSAGSPPVHRRRHRRPGGDRAGALRGGGASTGSADRDARPGSGRALRRGRPPAVGAVAAHRSRVRHVHVGFDRAPEGRCDRAPQRRRPRARSAARDAAPRRGDAPGQQARLRCPDLGDLGCVGQRSLARDRAARRARPGAHRASRLRTQCRRRAPVAGPVPPDGRDAALGPRITAAAPRRWRRDVTRARAPLRRRVPRAPDW